MKRRFLWFGVGLMGLFVVTLFVPLPKEHFRKESIHSLRVVDRRGVLLREFLNDMEGRGQWKSLNEIAPSFLQATIAVEDRRFRYHPGVDPFAIARAVFDNIKAGTLQSGGSTLTQQVIRNVYHHPRTLLNKLLEAWYALRLEQMMSKDEILEQYVNRAPYGNQLFGVEAAARWYFGKPARDLSLAESAFLSALPNAPTALNPYQQLEAAMGRQRQVLRRMFEQDRIALEEYQRALEQPLRILPPEVNFRAPHVTELAAAVARERSSISIVTTTIDYSLQQDIQWIVKGHLATLAKKNVTNAAVVVLDNRTREVRMMLGSANYFDEKANGQVNGTLALRQPGSAIKPFTYGVALEAGFSSADILADIPIHIPDDQGDYIPENYDKRYHGPVRLRTALACSYNVPAVRVAQAIGVGTLLQKLHQTGFTSLAQPASFYGYGLTLGNGEVMLLELTNAYASIADGGVWKPARFLTSLKTIDNVEMNDAGTTDEGAAGRRVFDKRVAFLLTDILSDAAARRPAFGNVFRFPFACAVKTGTTKDYRDNWTVGYTTDYTVGVWVGNFDGSPMRGVSGITGAGQIFFDIMMLLHKQVAPGEFVHPVGVIQVSVCPKSGKQPNDACGKTIQEWFVEERKPTERCPVHQLYKMENEVRAFEVLPPEFRSWAETEGIEEPPVGAIRVASRSGSATSLDQRRSKKLSILYPNDGDQFKLDPLLRPEYQSIKIIATAPMQSKALLHVDNEVYALNPSGVWWNLKRGKHTIRVEAVEANRTHTSEPVTIIVE